MIFLGLAVISITCDSITSVIFKARSCRSLNWRDLLIYRQTPPPCLFFSNNSCATIIFGNGKLFILQLFSHVSDSPITEKSV